MRVRGGLLAALSVAGLAGLSLASEVLAPPLIVLAELRQHEGEAVAVEARVVRSSTAASGQALSLVDPSGRASAFWTSTEPLQGALVRIEGVAEKGRIGWQIRARSLTVVAPAEEPWSLAEVARLAPLIVGFDASVEGTLRLDPELGTSLVDGDVRVLLDAPREALSRSSSGERVVARGAIRFDRSTAAYRLDAWDVRPA